MRALIFAAGLGERMRPLTDHTPKPLLRAGGKPLIVWHLERLADCGLREVVINTAWLAEQFPRELGDGARWGLQLRYSHEGPTPLETGGGMWHALALLCGSGDPSAFDSLRDGSPPRVDAGAHGGAHAGGHNGGHDAENACGDDAFLAINGDIWTDADLQPFATPPRGDAHLLLVDNPEHNPGGDFALGSDGHVRSQVTADAPQRLTFAGIGSYRARLLDDWRAVIGSAPGADATPPRFKLAPLLRAAMDRGSVTGARHAGRWTDVGTPQRLQQLDHMLSGQPVR